MAREGANLLPRPTGPSLARQLLDQMFHFFAVMLWVAAVLAYVGGMPQLAVAIVAVIVVNGLFSFTQEYRAERAVRALSALLPETAVVRRDGRPQGAGSGRRPGPRRPGDAPRGRSDLCRRSRDPFDRPLRGQLAVDRRV